MALRAPNCLPLDHGQTRGGIFGEGIFDGPGAQTVPQDCTPRRPVPTNQHYNHQVGFQPSPYASPVMMPAPCPPAPCRPRCPSELVPTPVTPGPQPERPRPVTPGPVIPGIPGDVPPDDRRPTPITPTTPGRPEILIPSIPGIPGRPIIPTPGRIPSGRIPSRVPGSSVVGTTTGGRLAVRPTCDPGFHFVAATGRCEPDKLHGFGHYAQGSGIFGTPNCGNGAGVPYAASPYSNPVTVPAPCPPPRPQPVACPPGLPYPVVPDTRRPCPPQLGSGPCPPGPPFPRVPPMTNGCAGFAGFRGFGSPDGLMGIR